MNLDLNKVILIGRLANDIELTYTNSGIAKCSFRIAVNRPQSADSRAAGNQSEVDFISVIAWRQSAEYISKYAVKGNLISVDGRLQVREFTHNDVKRRETEVVAENLALLEKKSTQDTQQSPVARPQQPAPTAPRTTSQPTPVDNDDEMSDPFAS